MLLCAPRPNDIAKNYLSLRYGWVVCVWQKKSRISPDSVDYFSSPPAPPPHLSAAMTAHHHHPWSVEVLNTSRTAAHPLGGRGNIRRSHDPLASPTLGANGVRTLYEAMRRGRDINPLGPCLGYRATRYIFMKFLDIRYAYPDSHFNPLAPGLLL